MYLDAYVGGYEDWRSSAHVSCPLTRDVTLKFSSIYLVRDNEPVREADGGSEFSQEVTEDYARWANRVGTDWAPCRSVRASAYVEHVLTQGDSESLEDERLTAGITASYTYEF